MRRVKDIDDTWSRQQTLAVNKGIPCLLALNVVHKFKGLQEDPNERDSQRASVSECVCVCVCVCEGEGVCVCEGVCEGVCMREREREREREGGGGGEGSSLASCCYFKCHFV